MYTAKIPRKETTRIYITLDNIRCHRETADEWGPDEPYVIVTAIDLRAGLTVRGFPIPFAASRAFLYGPFDRVDDGETHFLPFFAPFWGLFGEERGLPNPNDAVFIVSLMENDDGRTVALRGLIAAQANSALFASLNVTDRKARVCLVLEAVNSAMNTPTGFPSADESIGYPQELLFTPEEIALAETGQGAFRSLLFEGDGGSYTLTFQARNRGQAAWRFCSKCYGLFFDALEGKGVCPAGGGHTSVLGGYVYYLPHEHSGPWGGQHDWRFCDKCYAMFWAGDPARQGVCKAGGSHNAQGYLFFLPHDHSGPGQEQWRFCDKCRMMFYNGAPHKGVCPTGGGHNAQGFNFKLDFTP